jgi:uncharacterized FAD-dependent dehydrogenase
MNINTNIAMSNIPIKTGNVSQVRKNDTAPTVNGVVSATENDVSNESGSFSLVLTAQQEQTINDTIGYDQPSAKSRTAIDAYQDVAIQEKRDQIIDSMSFHFVV